MSAPTPSFPRTAIIGRGRMGTALANAMHRAGLAIDGPFGRGEAPPDGAELMILCVPDAQIAHVAAGCPDGVVLAHCSGATTLAPFAMHEAFSMHPLLTVTKETTDFTGVGCAVHANSDRARALCLVLVAALGMHPFAVADDLRALYHASASVAANYVVTIAAFAETLAAAADVERALLVPLARAAIDNWARFGPAALTGPIARGDDDTVARQRAAVAAHAPDSLALWDALADATRLLAARSSTRNLPTPT